VARDTSDIVINVHAFGELLLAVRIWPKRLLNSLRFLRNKLASDLARYIGALWDRHGQSELARLQVYDSWSTDSDAAAASKPNVLVGFPESMNNELGKLIIEPTRASKLNRETSA